MLLMLYVDASERKNPHDFAVMGIQVALGCWNTGRSAPVLEREGQVKAAWQQSLFDCDFAYVVGSRIGRRGVGVFA
jgi:hypothetical protein